MKKAIVAVPYLSGKGGTETVIKNFHEAISEYGRKDYSWKLVSYGGTKYSNWMSKWNKTVYFFSNNRYIQMVCYMCILPFLIPLTLKKEKPDFWIATNPIIWSIAYYARRFVSPNTKIISWYHFSFKQKKIRKKYLKTVDNFWAISTDIKNELVSMGVEESSIAVIYNPIPLKDIKAISRSGHQNRFIYIGRIDYEKQKNVSDLIRALNELSGEWQCDIYGSIDVNTKNRLLKLITNPNVKNKINFKGFYEDVWKEIKIADVLILTSKYEGLPMVLCEAAARGISLEASNCSGVSDIVTSKNGEIFEIGDYGRLCNNLESIVNRTYKLPGVESVEESVCKFNYKSYVQRIYANL